MMAGPSCDPQSYPITVVIATLGGDSLKGTINALNRGSIVPHEILVCIPASEAHKVQSLSYHNVEIIVTDCRGQVAQRAIGFQNASHDVVMQLDDDILVDEECVERLLKTLRIMGTEVAVAPSLMSLSTGESVYRQPAKNKLILKVYYWLMNGSAGYQPGKIDKSGSAVGIDPKNANDESFDVEWLAGACVMHYRKNLILENFYPFEGKAYHEDVIHSYHLKKRGIRLKVVPGARCWLKPIPSSNYGQMEFLEHFASDYRARKYSMRLRSRSSLRIYIFYLVSYLSYMCKKANGLITSEGNRESR
jgi:glycosyltransferase involved in cell wall biosynthesis